MAVTIYIKVDNLATVLETFTHIKVYRSTTGEDGSFSEITDSSTRIPMNVFDNLYLYEDSSGTEDLYYRASYFDPAESEESAQSGTIRGTSTSQLLENMQVVITVDGSIANTDGVELGDDLEFYFTTKYNPLYSTVRKIRLDIGKFIEGIPDDTINFAIFEASREADFLTFIKDASKQTPLYVHARRQWTTCKAEQILLFNAYSTSGGLLKSKRLGDFEVVYDRAVVDNLNNRLMDCLARWEAEINSGGAAIQTPSMVIKGELDPDRPDIGRTWEGPYDGMPIGNAKIKYANNRRFFTTFYQPKKRWGGK